MKFNPKRLQSIYYLGPEGTYTEQAAIRYNPSSKRIPLPSIDDVFNSIVRKTDLGIVPIENIIEGPVTETLSALLEYEGKVNIVDMNILPIQHAIGVLPGHEKIKSIISKDQALKQCSNYIKEKHQGAELTAKPSTAAAIKEIAEQKIRDTAAIGDERTLRKYNLEILDKNIGNVKNNKTKFAILGRYIAEKTGRDATSIVVYPHKDRIGLLDDMTKIISKQYRINMTSFQSRPDTRGGYRFFIELEGHIEDSKIKNCLKEMKKKLGGDYIDIKILGSYPRKLFIEPQIKDIGIIGGTGKMGGWFKEFFEKSGYDMLISGRKTPLTYENCVKKSDVVIVNVPITNTVEVIKKISPYFKKGQLIVDNCSIKTQAVKTMFENVKKDIEVLGMHTIFGPKITDLYNQNVAFVHTEKSGEIARQFEDIFHKHGARIHETTCGEHDKQMAFHQNLEHFTKIALAELIRQEFEDPNTLENFTSPNSETSLITIGRILSSSPSLLAEIQAHNTNASEIISRYVEIVKKMGKQLIKRNPECFQKSMEESIKYFGKSWIKQKVAKSKKIQEALSENS
ncbi:hypothetical protein COS75_00135 [Candidatus Pacearchaeota archaeon CG06_land_8_20_14_3_00_35_12]|nr:MAG: hypothetical protein COS75_00135 [Candidatus Pacearchaeota archaeon CG06_land_8_20_14_3_00_35_12]